jgi:hypothetical protein
MDVIERLKTLYAAGNKHDNYQNLPGFVQERLGFNVIIDENWRGDTARFNFFQSELNFLPGESATDIGANTGFFTLSLAHHFPKAKFIACEINPDHVEFIREIASHFNMTNVEAIELAVDMKGIEQLPVTNHMLHFNVLHHAGVDFDKGTIPDENNFFDYSVSYLSALKRKTKNLVFQMGYNWGGNKLKPIVPLVEDARKLTYTIQLFQRSGWSVNDIAHCSRTQGMLAYQKMPMNILDDLKSAAAADHDVEEESVQYLSGLGLENLSEFYRRPIFITSANAE